MKLKLDEHGHVVVVDGKPVYTHDDGKDVPFDAPLSMKKINELNGEAKGHREAKEAAEARLKDFEGLEDVEAARKAMETVKNLSVGDLKTAAQVEEIKKAAQKAAEEQVAEANKASGTKIQTLEQQLAKVNGEYDTAVVTNAFAGSKFLKDKVEWPADAVQAIIGRQFRREDGRLVGYDSSGNKIYSRTRPGEVADFEEALEMSIDAYPHRDSMLKGTQSKGSGGQPLRGNDGKGGKTISRAEFGRLDPMAQGDLVRGGTSVVD